MNDLALSLLLDYVDDSQQLWVVDEQGVDAVLPLLSQKQLTTITFLSNRYDQYLAIKEYTDRVFLNDFDGSVFEKNTFDKIFFRVSKEKAVVHHVINISADLLKLDGDLVLSGFKNDGIQTYIKKAEKYLGVKAEKKLGGKTSAVALIKKSHYLADRLDDVNYSALSLVEVEGLNFYTKPGVFGWKKIDKGSALLIDTLDDYLKKSNKSFDTVLDLGCGYGYLTMAIHESFSEAEFFATDNNMAALACCKENFQLNNITGKVFMSDAGDVFIDDKSECLPMKQSFDLVICNPPFHQGFQHQTELTEKFIRNTYKYLTHQGLAIWVVNAFIPVERLAKPLFSQIELLANNSQFKVYLLMK